nr:hypothetical protein [Pseudobdellovibrionaceae bacterium]
SGIYYLGCASKLSIQTDPPQADVFVSIEGKADKNKVGQTPLELTEPQLHEMLKITPETASWVEFTFVKPNFETKTVFLPSSRFGELSRTFKIKLNPNEDSSTTVTRMMRYFFNAKKFAETKQYEQAHQEIDKIVALDNKIAQAYVMKGGVYFLQNNLEDSTLNYRKALEIDPSFSEAIQMLDRIKAKSGASE